MKTPTVRSLRRWTGVSLLAATSLLLSHPSSADNFRRGTTALVSTFPDGSPADGGSASVSSDGRYVAFDSWDRLASGDSDDFRDIYRKDMQTGETVLVSTNVTGPGWNAFEPSISGDGNKVAYVLGACYGSDPVNVVISVPSCVGTIAYVKDTSTGTLVAMARPGSLASAVQISRNGQWATVVAGGGDASVLDVFNTTSGEMKGVVGLCQCQFQASDAPPLSADGRYIAVDTIAGRVGSDVDNDWDVYLYDRDADNDGVFDEYSQVGGVSFTLVGIRPQGDSPYVRYPALSDDANTVVYLAGDRVSLLATNLQLFSRDLATGEVSLVSQSSQGLRTVDTGFGPGVGHVFSITGDGRYVGFASPEPYLSSGSNPLNNIFIRDRALNKTFYASSLPDESPEPLHRIHPSLSADGRYVAFETTSYLSEDRRARLNRRVYLRDLSTDCSIACIDDVIPTNPVRDVIAPEAVLVDSNNPQGASSSWLTGRSYRATATGTYHYAFTSGGAYLADAECSTLDGVNWSATTFGTTALDLLIDGSALDWVPVEGTASSSDPRCSASHAYVTSIQGRYLPANFKVNDLDYWNNAGSLDVVLTSEE